MKVALRNFNFSWRLPWLQRFLTLHTSGYDSMSVFLVGDSGQVQFKVSVDEYLINFVIQRDIRYLVDVSMKEGKVPISVILLN
jgi:hypothetical protein